MIVLASNGSAVLLPAWMLNFTIAVFVQSTIVIAAGLIFAAWLRRRDVATGSIILRSTVIAGMLCPLILCIARRSEAFTMHVRLPLQEHSGRLVGALTAVAWVAVALAMIVRIMSSLRSLRRLRRDARSASYQWIEDAGRCARAIGMAAPSVLQTAHVTSPCLTGYKRPTILLPAARSQTRHDILLHEMAHVRRNDCLWHLLAYVATAMLWFQPLMWVLTRRLITTADEACDDFVLAYGSSRSDYARVLIDLAEQHKGSWQGRRLAVGLVHWKSTLSRRVVNIMDTSRDVVIEVRKLAATSGILFLAAVMILASLVAINLSIAADPAPPAPARAPIPDAAAQSKTEKLVRDVFGNYAASPLAGRSAIAAKMLEQGIATADDPAARYVLLKDAGELAAGAGDAATAMRAATTMASFYAVDEGELKYSLLRRCATAAANPTSASAVAIEGLTCANDAVSAGNYDQANRFMQPTEQAARASKNVTLILVVQARAADIKWLQQESARAKTAEEKLGKAPTDPEANHALGRYFCLVRGDWKKGLIGLSIGSNAAWQAASAADLANPTTSDKQVAAGDLWWDLAEKESAAVAQRGLRRRAGYWYSLAAANPQFTGLKRSLVEKRLAQMPPSGAGEAVAEVPGQPAAPSVTPPAPVSPAVAAASGTWIDLLRIIDPAKDGKVGNWKLENGVLLSDHTNGARVQIPYLPPEEYDFRTVFSRNEGTSAVVQFTSRQAHEIIWDIGRGNPHARFTLNEKPIEPPFTMENGHKYTSLIKVRRGSVQFFLDDRLILEEKDDARLYDPGTWYALQDKRCLGIGSHFSPTSFYSVEVLEVSGHGSAMRPASGNIFTDASPNAVTNTLGMKLVLIPAGEFNMGSPLTEEGRKGEETLHRVKITKPFLMATTAVTQAQWSAVMGSNPSKFQGDARPVEKVSWNDAVAFCEKLSAKEGKQYRLPTEAEWEYACRAGTQTAYGGANNLNEMAWYKDNSDGQTHPAAQKKANAWGLYDMQGNVNQWCSDGYGGPYGGDAVDPKGANGSKTRVVRGGAWKWTADQLRAAWRGRAAPGGRHDDVGFRVCLDATQPLGGAATPGPAYVPPAGGSIFTDPPPHPDASANLVTNTLGMKLVLIPAGEFNMGSPETEVGRENNEKLHRVKITRAYLIAATLVTQANWKAIMGKNPSGTKGDELPVDEVSWHDAVAFCENLSAKEGKHYRLPTEAEWEYAARAGTQTPFSFGDGNIDDFAWYQANSQAQIHNVATKKPNRWGLFDMQGNLWQWCSDWYGVYDGDGIDPKGVEESRFRVMRGGSFQNAPAFCRAARRHQFPPNERGGHIGFRVCFDAPQPAGAAATPGPAYVPPAGGSIFADSPAPAASVTSQSFAKERNALPAEQQIAATLAKLNEVNGGHDMKAEIRANTDGTLRVNIVNQDALESIEPLFGLKVTKLNIYSCRNLRSLSGVQGLPLTDLSVTYCPALEGDLSVLKGMQLTQLNLTGCQSLRSLNGIQGMPLTGELSLAFCSGLQGDLSALAGMRLTKVQLRTCQGLSSLKGLEGMPLTELDLGNMYGLDDLLPLKGMPLTKIVLSNCRKLKDLSGLQGAPLKELELPKQLGHANPRAILDAFPTIEVVKTGDEKTDSEIAAEIARRKASSAAPTPAADPSSAAKPGIGGSIFGDTGAAKK